MALEFTGERFLPSCEGEMVYEHWHRYLFAADYASGLRVLDVACGEGYGSALLATKAASVTGIDVSPDAIHHATNSYHKANLAYLCASCTSIPLPDASYDLIVSFETIEHITEHQDFLREVARLLSANGVFIISSPNRIEYSDRAEYSNEFHVKELDKTELRSLLDNYFPAQKWFAQRPCFQSLLWPIDTKPEGAKTLSIDGQAIYPAELYFVVCCAREEQHLAAIAPSLSLVADNSQSVYAEWSRTYKENRNLKLEVEVLKKNLGDTEQRARSRWKALFLSWLKL